MARILQPVTAPTGEAVRTNLLPRLMAALDGSGPALLPVSTGGERRPLLASLRPDLPLEADDVALVLPTSGSTGEPKGVLLSATALLHSADAAHVRLGGPGQWLLALPVNHIGGIGVLVRSVAAGIAPEILDLYGGFNVGAFEQATARLRRDARRYVSLVPVQLHRLLDAGVDLSTYDGVLLGGAAATRSLLARADEAGARVVVSYGMSETSGGCVYDGVPLDGVDVALEAEGRITVAGSVVFSGYRLRPDLTAQAFVAGRYVSNDLGAWSHGGRLEVLARTDDVIVSGGVNVSASRVEQALSEHPGVRRCVVIPLADDEWGQRVVAVIEPRRWDDVPNVDALRSFARATLEPAALPAEVVVLGALPMASSGKPDRRALQALVASRLVARPAASTRVGPNVVESAGRSADESRGRAEA